MSYLKARLYGLADNSCMILTSQLLRNAFLKTLSIHLQLDRSQNERSLITSARRTSNIAASNPA